MKQQNQYILLAVLVLLAVGIWVWQSYTPKPGGKGPSISLAQNYQPLNFPNPRIREDKVERRRNAQYVSRGVNLFAREVPPSRDELEKAEQLREQQARDAAARAQQQLANQQATVEIPPNMKFFGYGNVPNNTARRAFFEDGEEVYIVNEGDTLLGRFRIVKINNASVEFEEVGSGRRGMKMMEDSGPAA